MSWDQIILIVQAVVSVLLIAAILLQNRGASLGESFGGSGALFGTRRGPEKALYYITIVLAVLFVGLSLAALLI